MGARVHPALAVSGGAGPLRGSAGAGAQPESGGRRGGGGRAEECGRAAGGAAPPPGAARAGRRRERRAGRGRARESGRAAGGPRQGVAAGPTGPRGRWAAVGSCCPCPETLRTWPGRPPPPAREGRGAWETEAAAGPAGWGGVGARAPRRGLTWAALLPAPGPEPRDPERGGLPARRRGAAGRVSGCGRERPRTTRAREERCGNGPAARGEPAREVLLAPALAA